MSITATRPEVANPSISPSKSEADTSIETEVTPVSMYSVSMSKLKFGFFQHQLLYFEFRNSDSLLVTQVKMTRVISEKQMKKNACLRKSRCSRWGVSQLARETVQCVGTLCGNCQLYLGTIRRVSSIGNPPTLNCDGRNTLLSGVQYVRLKCEDYQDTKSFNAKHQTCKLFNLQLHRRYVERFVLTHNILCRGAIFILKSEDH